MNLALISSDTFLPLLQNTFCQLCYDHGINQIVAVNGNVKYVNISERRCERVKLVTVNEFRVLSVKKIRRYFSL